MKSSIFGRHMSISIYFEVEMIMWEAYIVSGAYSVSVWRVFMTTAFKKQRVCVESFLSHWEMEADCFGQWTL